MMVMSMTGYGSDTFHIEESTITVEIRSVNSRYLDFVTKMPRSFHEFEVDIKKMVQTYFSRGRIEVYVTVTGDSLTNKSLTVNWELLDHYIARLNEMKNRYNIQDEVSLANITNKEEFITVVETDKKMNTLQDKLLASVKIAAERVEANRQREGSFLQKDINERIIEIKNMVSLIEEQQKVIYYHYRERIQTRIEEHIGNKLSVDQSHLLQEIALLAEKGDIAEEITRLHSHLAHFTETIQREGEPTGRKLDFITQEMHREINTIGSKSVDIKISEHVVLVKSEIDKIKEQIQNIE